MIAATQNPRLTAPAVESVLAPDTQSDLEQTLANAAHDYVFETTYVSRDREIAESTSILRGLAIATVVSLPMWGLLIWGISSIIATFQ